MTALPEFALLECPGWYAETPDAPPEEVVVCFGDATLILRRFDETPLAHWPLATLTTAPGGRRLTLKPDEDAPERLGLDDPTMIAALARVRGAAVRGRRRASRGLAGLTALALIAAAGFGLWRAWPDIMVSLALQTPFGARAAVGDAAAARLADGRLCLAPAVLARTARAAGLEGAARLWLVDRGAADGPVALPAPGERVVILAPAMRAGDPDALLAAVAAATQRGRADPPIAAAFRGAGWPALTGGSPAMEAMTEAAARALRDAAAGSREARATDAPATGALSEVDWRALTSACRR
jgi:hypothetical protein